MALSVLGTIGLVIYTFPYLGLFCIPFGAFLVRVRVLRTTYMNIATPAFQNLTVWTVAWLTTQYLVSVYYRATSREVKRLDSILRGQIYTCLSEQVSSLRLRDLRCGDWS
jgi:hypothetical protein